MRRSVFIGILGLLWGGGVGLCAQTHPDTWTAQDALGRKIGSAEQYGTPRPNKTVGMFFVIWHGAHGYDRNEVLPDLDVMKPGPSDTCSPYDIQKILDANPSNPQYGPQYAFHHWGEPYMGYYVSNDEWIIRKHAQMLSDAGVDVIIFDVTNEVIYLPIVTKMCEVYTQMRQEGSKTPQIAFILNTNADKTLQHLYDAFYKKGSYKDLWFYWKGKPLIFAPPATFTAETGDFFNGRYSWFDARQAWFGDGYNRCPWADYYPQKYGWHEDPNIPEMVSVAPATHPTDRMDGVLRVGRSYHQGRQPEKADQQSELGRCFDEQFSRAMELDPEFIFFTGWNEWSAMRFINQGEIMTLGDSVCKVGESYFCDDFNHEYSRDIEPLRGGFGDNYYYQLADFIRRYKGVPPAVTYTKKQHIDLKDNSIWQVIKASYTDDRSDVFHRNHWGYGRIGQCINTTGRNDIIESKVAHDGKTLWFYVRTTHPITPCTDPKWMQLFIHVNGLDCGNWEGFQYVVNNPVIDTTKTTLAKSRNGWNWAKIAELDYRTVGNELVIAIPLTTLGIQNPKHFSIEFKWIDNAVSEGDIQECLTDGDAAPNGRFRYRYLFKN